MKKIICNGLALGLSLVLTLQTACFGVWAQTDLPDPSSGPSAPASSEPASESQDAGPAGPGNVSPLSGQEDSARNSGAVSSAEESPAAPAAPAPLAEPASYQLTLNLDGGQVNTLHNAGWVQSSVDLYQWSRSLTENTAGQGITVTADATLGGLLPGEPYRAGYTFAGWTIADAAYDAALSAPVTITADTVVTARWQIASYTVSFHGDAGELWSVSVPFGATLWTESSAPWTADDLVWNDDTAAVSVTLGGVVHDAVTVTRHPQEDTSLPAYYYTFRLNDIPYFTYGGPEPTKSGQHFSNWKLLSGGSGFTVTGDAVFAARFQAEKSYVFNVYFYYRNSSKAAETLSIAKQEADITDGKLTFAVDIPAIAHYTPQPVEQNGVSWSADGKTVTVDVNAVFGAGNAETTNFLALTVMYLPASIQYTVEYYQQPLGTTDLARYELVGSTAPMSAEYGGKIAVQDRPDLDSGASFDGFLIHTASQSAVAEGVVLREGTPNVVFDAQGNATVRVYYDRSSYFIYFQTGTSEVQLDHIKVTYGAALPDFSTFSDQLHRTGYADVTPEDILLYRLDADGSLQALASRPADMPAYDLYAVVQWTPATTSIRLVYWVESRNAASFQNVQTITVPGVKTESELTVGLRDGVTVQGSGLPADIDGTTVISEGFSDLMEQRYGSAQYGSFFSYSAAQTKASPGNTANAEATGTGNVTDGAITGDSYTVRVNGDGTTVINIYYTRNLYTLEFVIARGSPDLNTLQVADSTPGRFDISGWKDQSGKIDFLDFSGSVSSSAPSASEQQYGDMQVTRIYRLTDAETRDTRSAVGRYGTKTINGYPCLVYTLTARFEADIAALWPTAGNIARQSDQGNYTYISMGTSEDSYYRNVVATTDQKNILNAYSSMDFNVVTKGTSANAWTAAADDGSGQIAHQMIAYWATGAAEYQYYFLYETLDTTIPVGDVDIFYPGTADRYEYTDGQYVSWNGKVYVYSAGAFTQYSTSTRSGQNQPSRHGFVSAGKRYYAGTDDEKGGNIYFFYDREVYTLSIQNVRDLYRIPDALLTTEFSCLSDYGTGARTLRQLGWIAANDDGSATLRYGAALAPLHETEIVEWLTDNAGGAMEYPFQSAGENQYYFWRWYHNALYTVPIDWANDNEMMTISANTTLYAGWFSPRYVTTYVLNGGTWTDSIEYTLTNTLMQAGHTVYIYYPHQADSGDAPLYWYVQSKDDRLFVDELYLCKVSDVADRSDSGDHWVIRDGLTADQLMAVSTEDFQGSRLVGHYYCYMGRGLEYNHERYVNINATVNTILAEPSRPIRTGYTFLGWYYFDGEPPAGAAKTYLRDVLTGTQSLASYDEGYVYINHVSDAFLLHKDENGELFYYADQTGYRFSYANNASVVVRDRQLYAAWQPNGDASGVVYHLVDTETPNIGKVFTPQGGSESIFLADAETVVIGDRTYYVLRQESLPNLYTGTTYPQAAWEYCTDESGRKWLPVHAQIDLLADERTQTVTDPSDADSNSYRIENPDGSYTYYAFFVYEPTDEVVYHVYAIDLSVAVAEGILKSYQDTFDRTFQVDQTARYFLGRQDKSVRAEEIDTTFVVETAPTVSGYSVYQDWNQTLQLQTQSDANNIFFYYVRDAAQIRYDVIFYLMTDGGYSAQNTVTVSDIPAVTGEIVSLTDLAGTYDRLLSMAQTYSTYAGADNTAQQSLYQRYRDMTVMLTRGGTSTYFAVDASLADTLDLASIAGYSSDYYVDAWSPGGESLVVSHGTTVEVYLASAQLVIQKTDTSQLPLQGAEFTLERLTETADGDIIFEGRRYAVDPSFRALSAVSGEDGKAIFHNLSARVFEDGQGYLYRLTEAKAPPGYNRLASPLYVSTPYTVGDEVSYSVTYTVVNTGVAYLPKTGFFGGVYTVMFFGAGLMAAAVGCGIVLIRRRVPCPASPGRRSSSHHVQP